LGATNHILEEKTLFSMMIPKVRTHLKQKESITFSVLNLFYCFISAHFTFLVVLFLLLHSDIRSILLTGLETHVCVLQTTLDLLSEGYEVHIVTDAVSSQDKQDRKIALERLKQSGAFLTTSESAIFMLMGDTSYPKFKEISNLMKDHKQVLKKLQQEEDQQNVKVSSSL
jgi:hypothetical protein